MVCMIAQLDADAAEKLRVLRDAALPAGRLYPPIHGHITIATYLPEDDSGFCSACVGTFRGTAPFRVRYNRIEVLSETDIIAAIPAESDILAALHGRIAAEYGASLDRWTRGSDWYPHTTLLYDPAADLDAIRRKMQARFTPFEAGISRIALSKVEKTGYTILDTIELVPGGT